MKTNRQLAAFAESLLSIRANTWYMYGNNGHEITESFIQVKKAQYPDRYSDSHIAELRKHIGAIGYDCSSITDIFVGPDRSANGWLNAASEKGPIASIPDLPGLTVHYNGHMGVTVGGGWVVEARGTWHGIVKTRLSDRPWKNWAKVPGLSYEEGTQDMIRAGDKGEAVKAWQNALMLAGYSLDPYGADGSFGPLSQKQTNAFKADAGLALDTPVTVAEDEWLAWGRMMAAKAQAKVQAQIADADARAKDAESARLVAESKIAAIRKAIGTLKEI